MVIESREVRDKSKPKLDTRQKDSLEGGAVKVSLLVSIFQNK